MVQYQPQYQPVPKPAQANVGAVHIQIYNPTVNGQNQAQGQGYNAAPNYYQQPQPRYYPINQNVTQNTNVPRQNVATPPINKEIPSTKNTQNTNTPIQAPTAATTLNTKEKEEKKKTKEIVQLTDEYIKTLENYLNNPNAEIRKDAAVKLLKRFKEEKSRRNDIALTNLLNKALQDPSQAVRLLALSTLDSGYANGDKMTVKLLKEMEKSDQVYNQDALLASSALLKMAGKKIDVTTDEIEAAPLKDKQIGNKLDIIAK